ncbi:hypothetical protein [Streptomyces olivochromogenes]|uniref:hypothetical protein n=1 Tax=Streptomyces olivochromogenes TaxID=1963 RepID=UPI001F391D95|nr:hypothetical protein [Streptomyces olivochromogenes]MCF3129064.1 hypothetical protein [Streptomyces olivochromogenes]
MLSTLAVLACPTSASAEDTPATLEVTGGGLGITVPQGPVDLGTVTVSSTPQSVTNQLGNVTVTDQRGGTAGWTTTAQAVDFIGPSNTTISVSAPNSSTYHAPQASVIGTATATWNPTISITVPANSLAGTYTSTITHSVA